MNKPLFLDKQFISLLSLCRNAQYWLHHFILILKGELNIPPPQTENKNEKLIPAWEGFTPNIQLSLFKCLKSSYTHYYDAIVNKHNYRAVTLVQNNSNVNIWFQIWQYLYSIKLMMQNMRLHQIRN